MRLALSALAIALTLPTLAPAQSAAQADTILVLDASGSMWGQIDGVNKIVIAREVVADLLADFPADQNLGLTVYGHRVRGECTDIETVIAPAPGTGPAISEFVNQINPRGMTPMTDSVIAAAESLRFTERKATVILVSDGIETCNPDPCAAARVLEQTGVDFTAHVVGFDVAGEAEALAQMQCLADETGGLFLTADNADELSTALATVAAAIAEPEPEPVLVNIQFDAILGEDGERITTPVLWDVNDGSGLVLDDVEGNPMMASLEEGDFVVTAYAAEFETEVNLDFTVAARTDPQTVTVVFPEPVATATVDAPDSAPLGSNVEIAWTGPGEDRDYISVGEPGTGTAYVNYTYIEGGNPLVLQMPPTAGTYEVRYQSNAGGEVLATDIIEVAPVEVTLTTPATAIAGDTISVAWTGPGYDRDYISVGEVGEDQYINYTYVEDGSPLTLLMPTQPGDYEIRYQLQQDAEIIHRVAITVTDVTVAITAPETAVAGETISVAWTGPGYDRDYISVGEVGEDQYINYTYVEEGSPLTLLMPTQPGTYEIRYQLQQDAEIIHRIPITVTDVTVAITAPETAVAGETISVAWTGPGYDRDYISVGEVGADQYINYTYVEEGSPLPLTMPTQPGTYEIRYQLQQDAEIIHRIPITVTDLKIEITAPDTAVAGASIMVEWTGPGYDRDYISVGEVGEDAYINYTYVEEGSPLPLRLPTDPGTYEIRYQLQQDAEIIHRIPITVTEVKASLVAPATIPLSGTLIVGWDGPDYPGDYVSIGLPGDDGYLDYTRTESGNPLTLRMPEAAGQYELRYHLDQDGKIIARLPIEVTAQ